MSDKNIEELVGEITQREWDMFQKTQNIGGRAACQNDRETFEIMRKSQWETCNTDVLNSYLTDLITAQTAKNNLLTEKYARMMEYTMPGEYEKIKDKLPEISDMKKELTEKILDIYIPWRIEVNKIYPKISEAGRPLKKSDDTSEITSVETYYRGELLTYSEETLKLYYSYVLECVNKNRNLVYENFENMVKMYGYNSIEDAEKKL
jgi:DNA-directed RNA polymerase subunit F